MRQRLKVWFARLALAALCASPLVALAYVPVKHSHQFYPYGRIHSVLEGVAVVGTYALAVCLSVCLVTLTVASFATTVGWLWCVARRRPHRRLWRSWSNDPHRVRYDKPAPLVRGRLGSR